MKTGLRHSSAPSVSVILPTYNESGNIVPLLIALQKGLQEYKADFLVADDNSPDGTSDTVLVAKKKYTWKNVAVLTRTHDRGLTNSIRDGISCTTGDIVVWMDCDFSHPPEIVPLLVAEVAKGYDAAVASRFAPLGKQKVKGHGDSQTAIGLSTALNVLLKILFRFDFHDYTSGFIAIRRTVLLKIPLRGDYGEYFIDLMCRFFFAGYRAKEIPFTSGSRLYGESKTGSDIGTLVHHGKDYFGTVLRIVMEHITGKI
jgi:dolichol-phosphate mannosyltransferase